MVAILRKKNLYTSCTATQNVYSRPYYAEILQSLLDLKSPTFHMLCGHGHVHDLHPIASTQKATVTHCVDTQLNWLIGVPPRLKC